MVCKNLFRNSRHRSPEVVEPEFPMVEQIMAIDLGPDPEAAKAKAEQAKKAAAKKAKQAKKKVTKAFSTKKKKHKH